MSSRSGRARKAAREHERQRAAARRRWVSRFAWAGGIAATLLVIGVLATNALSNEGGPVGARADDPVLGSAAAPVTIIEYGDFKCPNCTRFAQETAPQLVSRYVNSGKARLVWRDFPVIDNESAVAAAAARCAGAQGKFWPYHDALYDFIWTNWYGAGRSAERVTAYDGHYEELAQSAGLDPDAFRACVSSGHARSTVNDSYQQGLADGVRGTPTFFVNGQRLVGAQPFGVFAQLIEQELSR